MIIQLCVNESKAILVLLSWYQICISCIEIVTYLSHKPRFGPPRCGVFVSAAQSKIVRIMRWIQLSNQNMIIIITIMIMKMIMIMITITVTIMIIIMMMIIIITIMIIIISIIILFHTLMSLYYSHPSKCLCLLSSPKNDNTEVGAQLEIVNRLALAINTNLIRSVSSYDLKTRRWHKYLWINDPNISVKIQVGHQ